MIITKLKYTEDTLNWVSIEFEDGTKGQSSLLDGISRQYTDDVQAYLDAGGIVEPQYTQAELDKMEADRLDAEWKDSRAKAVSEITVTASGKVFDGNEKAQDRMSRAILVMDNVETTTWVLADNTIDNTVTRAELSEALKLSGAAQTALWVK